MYFSLSVFLPPAALPSFRLRPCRPSAGTKSSVNEDIESPELLPPSFVEGSNAFQVARLYPTYGTCDPNTCPTPEGFLDDEPAADRYAIFTIALTEKRSYMLFRLVNRFFCLRGEGTSM